MQQDKHDEKIETGKPLPVEPEMTETEKDVDEQVHQRTEEVPDIEEEKDIDQLVHEQPAQPAPDPTKEIDPDDRVHDADQASFGSE